jgi:cytochrome P450
MMMFIVLLGCCCILIALLLVLRRFQSRAPTGAGGVEVTRDAAQSSVHVKGALGVHVLFANDFEHALKVQQLPTAAATRWLPGMRTDSLFPATAPEDVQRFKTVMSRALREYECRNGVIRQFCADLIAELDAKQPRCSCLDLFAYVHPRVAATMVRFAFGSQCGDVLIQSARAFDRASVASWLGLVAPRLARLLFPAAGRRADAAKAERERILREIRAGSAAFDDALLARMVAANTLERPLTDDELISNAIGIGVGGSDSTASALTSVLVHLALDAPLADRVAAEFRRIDDIDALWRLSDFEVLLPLTKRVVDEAIRAHPPFASLVPRCARQDFALADSDVQLYEGNYIAVDLNAVHRTKAPLEFDVERTPAAPSMAFGAGPRSCIAKALATRLLVAATAHIAGTFELSSNLLNSGAEWSQRSGVQQPARPFFVNFVKRK